jgi:hypothetical protein
MLYDCNGSRASAPRSISGHSLAQRLRRMSAPERAVLAADIIDGRVLLQGLTAKSIATIVGVNQNYLFAALRATPEQRTAIKNGMRPLIQPQPDVMPAPTTIDWARVDDTVLTDVVRAIGVDRTLDAAAAVEHATT